MRWLRRLLDLLPHDTLKIEGKPYMHRWYVFGYAPADLDAPVGSPGNTRQHWWWNNQWLGAVRIHCILASDDQRAFHDHPWPFVSIGLRGSYTELTPGQVRIDSETGQLTARPPDHASTHRHRFRAPFINHKAALDLHALVVERGPVWSLFLTRPKQRSWGFVTSSGFIPWREFPTAGTTVEPQP